MKRGKREMPRKRNARGMTAIVAVALILCCTVGGTLAWLATSTGPVKNTFEKTKVNTDIVETLNNGEKTNVAIANKASSIDVYVRATIVANWVDKNGNVYGKAPVEGTDYEVGLKTPSKWLTAARENDDPFYYYSEVVEVGTQTDYLFSSIKPIVTPPADYHLEVTILTDAIQADGVNSSNVPAVETVWPVTVNDDGSLSLNS